MEISMDCERSKNKVNPIEKKKKKVRHQVSQTTES